MTTRSTGAWTAADVMSQAVSLSERDSLQDAMRVMTELHVSGVPVIDSSSRCVGVLSTSDIVSFVESDQEALEGTEARNEQRFNPQTQQWEQSMFSPEMLGEYDSVPVSDVMTSDPLTVMANQAIGEVARTMVEHSIHRVFVVDEEQKLLGVISAFDFVRVIAEG